MTLEFATKNARAILDNNPELTATSVIEEDGNFRVLHFDPTENSDHLDGVFFAKPNVVAIYKR